MLMQGEKTFHYSALVIMTLMMLFCVVPLVLMFTVSLSSENSLLHGYRFVPEEWSFGAYQYLWAKRATIARAYGLTIVITVVGTIVSLIIFEKIKIISIIYPTFKITYSIFFG